MDHEQATTGYYRAWCNTLALVYDALTRVLGVFVGGERRFRARIVSATGIRGGDSVLDLGCGTGTLAILMAERVGPEGRVVGIDLSPRMLATARRKGSGSNLTFREANAEALPYPDASFDVVTATYTLHEMPRQARANALRECRRVLKPEGRLVVVDVHIPKSWWRRTLFRALMLFETDTAWDLARRGVASELAEAGFASVRQQFLHRDFVPVFVASMHPDTGGRATISPALSQHSSHAARIETWRKTMEAIIVMTTRKPIADACAALERSVAAHGFGILHVHNLGATLAKKGVPFDGDVRVYDVCNPQRAKEALDQNPLVAAALPCSVAVVGEQGGTRFALLRPTAILGLFGTAELDDLALDVEAAVTAIVEEAAR